jgi:hypothetical protein
MEISCLSWRISGEGLNPRLPSPGQELTSGFFLNIFWDRKKRESTYADVETGLGHRT